MLQKIVLKLRQRHFWRKATFSELSAFYVAELLRAMAMNLATLFIYSFLFIKGYSLVSIAIFSVYFQFLMLIFGVSSVYIVAFVGAKICLLVSNFVYIPALLIFAMFEVWGDTAVMFGGLFLALSTSIHHVSYNVLFSEIKSADNCAKEVGYMIIFHKIAGIITPIIGGLLATRFGAEVSMWIATGLFIVAAISMSRNQVLAKKRHQFRFEGFPWRAYMSVFLGQVGRGFDVVTGNFWPLFMIMFVMPGLGVYSLVGGLSSFNAIITFLIAFFLGKILDDRRQTIALSFKLGVIINSVVMFFRVFISSWLGVAVSEIGVAIGSTTYVLPYSKARYDAADRSGSRMVMELCMNIMWSVGSLIASIILLACLVYIPDIKMAMSYFFWISAVVFATFGLSKFPIFRN